MYYLGLDVGSSSVKAALVEAKSGKSILSVHEPKNEMSISSLKNDWAEQDPNVWWKHTCTAIKRVCKESNIDPKKIISIGISYQMHGLVLVDKNGKTLYNSIIWCDGRAVEIGNKAFNSIGSKKCMDHLLNSPGNFTASKLAWVKNNLNDIYSQIYKFMLPGDFLAFKLSGEISTTISGLSEGVFWDFKNNSIAEWLLDYYDINKNLAPEIVDNFKTQCFTNNQASIETGLPKNIPINYRSGDQPNNALSLNVMNPGEVAVTAGTSGVIYALTNNLSSKESLRINNFAHVNYSLKNPVIGKLLCINGVGIKYKWLKNILGLDNYEEMNHLASLVRIGSDGLNVFPFGNGPERIFNNKEFGSNLMNINFNTHTKNHLIRSTLEGIVYSMIYGLEILKNDNVKPNFIRVGNDNLFQSEIFSKTFSTLSENEIDIYDISGAYGAARAAAIKSDFSNISKSDFLKKITPSNDENEYFDSYNRWKEKLNKILT